MIRNYTVALLSDQMDHVDMILKAYLDMMYATFAPEHAIDPETAAIITAVIHFRNQIRQQ